jgi:holo-[acyl-carrier protein] synthase
LIFGIGIDMIEVSRLEKELMRDSEFVGSIFTQNEIDYCESKSKKAEHYAARYAAKEAFFKAIKTGWRGGMSYTHIEIRNDELGSPQITLFDKARELAEEINITNIHVSLSHLKELAVAVVILETLN